MKRTIYLLKGWTCYESDDLIAAYESKSDADAEAARLNALLLERPTHPPDIHGSEEEWEQYDTAHNVWAAKFPAKDLASCGGFEVLELDLIATERKPEP